MTPGQRITKLRKGMNLQQKEVAEAIGMNRIVLNRIELGKRPLRDDEAVALADFFHVTTDYLLKGTPSQDNPSPESGGYYTDPDVAQITEELRTDPDKRILFDATKDLSKDDINTVLKIIEGLKAREKE